MSLSAVLQLGMAKVAMDQTGEARRDYRPDAACVTLALCGRRASLTNCEAVQLAFLLLFLSAVAWVTLVLRD